MVISQVQKQIPACVLGCKSKPQQYQDYLIRTPDK